MRKSVVCLLLVLSMCSMAFADEIRIQGGGTSITTVFNPIRERFEKLYGHKLDIVQTSAVKALIALDQGKVDVASGAHPLEDLIAGAAKEGVRIDGSGIVATEIEDNRLVVIVDRNNPVKNLSKDQLRALFTGKTGNWKEAGGKDLPVIVVWGKETAGQNLQFSRIALDGGEVTPKFREVKTYREIVEAVSSTPGAVGVIPAEIASPVVHTVDTMIIRSPIYVFTKGAPNPEVRKLLDFYTSEFSFLREQK